MIQLYSYAYVRGVASSLGVPGVPYVMAHSDFGRSVNPISNKLGRKCPPNNTGTLGFSDLPTSLDRQTPVKEIAFANEPANQAPQ